jgi:hypothetical protein
VNFGESVPQNREWYRTDKISTASSPQIAATENGNVYLVWVDKNSTNADKILYFKRMSQFIFERNS